METVIATHSFCSSVLKASLHIAVTLDEPAGYLAEQFISAGAVEAGGLEFTLSSLWSCRIIVEEYATDTNVFI